MTKAEVQDIVLRADALIQAHGRRNPDHERATLAEEAAVFALSQQITDTLNRYRSASAVA